MPFFLSPRGFSPLVARRRDPRASSFWISKGHSYSSHHHKRGCGEPFSPASRRIPISFLSSVVVLLILGFFGMHYQATAVFHAVRCTSLSRAAFQIPPRPLASLSLYFGTFFSPPFWVIGPRPPFDSSSRAACALAPLESARVPLFQLICQIALRSRRFPIACSGVFL